MKKIVFVVGVVAAITTIAQNKNVLKFAKTIKSQELRGHLSVLASDEYEGRETGEKGQKMAAKYIADHFKSLNFEAPVDGSYYQSFELKKSILRRVYLKKGNEIREGSEDFIYYSSSETHGEEHIKVMLANEESDLESMNGVYIAYQAKKLGGYQDFLMKASEAGALGFFIFIESEDEFQSTLSRFKNFFNKPRLKLEGRDQEAPKLVIGSKKLATWLFDKSYAEIIMNDLASVVFNADYLDKSVITENVLGYLKGTEKPEELVVITSHYDHVGIIDGKIHNGADDDGSGTVSLLEIAEAFALAAKKGKGPKRSILFMTVTGEEKGLLGSKYYADIDPVFPLENTVVNLNIDMIGRVDDAHADNPDYIYLIGSDKLSQELHDLSEKVNETYTELSLDYTYNDENDPNRFYYRSDHYNFAKNNIPIIFYFNGTHEDYHQPTDTVEKIAFSIMESRARLVFHTAWEIANRDQKLILDEPNNRIE